MQKRCIYIILFILTLSPCWGQKIIQRSLDAAGIKRVEITSDQVFFIKIEASNTPTIQVHTEVEGENYENVVLSLSEKDGTLAVKTGYTPYFEANNDKLAAHKVISIEMTLSIPENLEVFISSFIASVEATGVFKNLYTGLNNGNCTLTNYLGDAQLNTRNGFIKVNAQAGVHGTAFSQRGRVEDQLPETGFYKVEAQSVNGDVILAPSQ